MKKSGFTLVELLAVIVILAIVIIIAIPNVLNSARSSKKESFKIFAQKVLTAAQEKVFQDVLNGNLNGTDSCHKASTNNPDTDDYKIDCCYTLDNIGIDGSDKYVGSVAYFKSTDTYKIFLTDGNYMTFQSGTINRGITIDELNDDTNIINFKRSDLYWNHNCGKSFNYKNNWTVAPNPTLNDRYSGF